MEESSRNVQISWAGRVRTGNKRDFDYTKDFEVICRFKETLTRKAVYKEIEKVKWPLSSIVGIVLRLGGLVDFTLKSKDLALKFAKSLSNLESIQNATAHADTVVEVRVDFIPPGFPTEPISEYLNNNHGEILTTPIRISDRFDIQTGTRVFKMERKNRKQIQYPAIFTLDNINFVFATKDKAPLVATVLRTIKSKGIAPKNPKNPICMVKNSKLQKRQAPRNENEQKKLLTKEKVAKSFERDLQKKKKKEN